MLESADSKDEAAEDAPDCAGFETERRELLVRVIGLDETEGFDEETAGAFEELAGGADGGVIGVPASGSVLGSVCAGAEGVPPEAVSAKEGRETQDIVKSRVHKSKKVLQFFFMQNPPWKYGGFYGAGEIPAWYD